MSVAARAADVVGRIRRAGVIAVVRAPSAEGAVHAGRALAAGGVRAIEITFSTPDAPAAISALREADGDLLVGAGTVTEPGQLAAVADAGAAFAVSPHTDRALVDAARATGILYVPGALTPTEIVAASALAPVVKLFPASVGGPGYLKAILAPFPQLQLVPTGGVDAGNVGAWLDAGAIAVGAGGDLCPGKLIASGDFDEIARRAQAYAGALAGHRRASA